MVKRKFYTDVEASVTITIQDSAPDDWLSRCFTEEWRESFYRLYDEGDVIDHFSYNAVANGIWSAHELDGWADVKPGSISFAVDVA